MPIGVFCSFAPPASDPQIIKAVNLDSEKLQRRDGEDGCRQFWSAYQQLQTGLLDVATAHATFAMKLHAHVMEPLKECGEQSEQVYARRQMTTKFRCEIEIT